MADPSPEPVPQQLADSQQPLREADVAEAPVSPDVTDRGTVDSLRFHLDSCELGHPNCKHCSFAAGTDGQKLPRSMPNLAY